MTAKETKKQAPASEEQDQDEGQLSLDIYQNDQHIIVLAPIAGIEQKHIKISITEDVLMIKGKRNFPVEDTLQECFTKECFWGNFSRSIVLPENVDITKIDANFKNSVLIIRIPKVDKVKTKVIPIK